MPRAIVCAGAAHAPDCEHQVWMQQGVERFLAHPRTRDALALALARTDHPVIDPHAQAITILVELAKGSELLDGLDPSNVEPLSEEDIDAMGELASYLDAILAGTETR